MLCNNNNKKWQWTAILFVIFISHTEWHKKKWKWMTWSFCQSHTWRNSTTITDTRKKKKQRTNEVCEKI